MTMSHDAGARYRGVAVSPSRIPAELLARYAVSGPRYTSYPTAPQFSADFDRASAATRWADSRGGGPVSLYVHLPFCRARCLYCACTTETGHDSGTIDSYVEALVREAEKLLSLTGDRPVAQLALGGGTPTRLDTGQLRRLHAALASGLSFTHDAERSIEVDPRTVDRGSLDLLCELGFNRFSFGVQDLDPLVQRAIGRVCPVERLEDQVLHLRARGAHAINLDLMYGLPLQNPRSFSTTLQAVLRLRPSRVAVFGYAHVPWVSPHQRALEAHPLPGFQARTALFGQAFDALTGAGYEHVGMDHFALPDDELIMALRSRSLTRNFMGYTTRRGLDLLGIGASAISSVNGTYTQNEKAVAPYLDRAPDAWHKGYLLSQEDLLRREVILELFCNLSVDLATIAAPFGVDAARHFAPETGALGPFERDGLVRLDGSRVSVTDLGRFFIRGICMTFDRYLKPIDGNGRYSSTV